MKKSLIFLFSLSAIISFTGCNKQEETKVITQDNIKYLVYEDNDNKVAMVVGYETSLANEVNLPSSINGYTVNAIRHGSFASANISKITIPESIVYIGYRAFAECTNLKEVFLPNSISTIYYNTFAECDSLESIAIPNNVETIDDTAFIGCDNLKSITLPNNLTSLGFSTFLNCVNLNNVDLTNTKLTTISDYCFAGCSLLNDIKLGNINKISSGAFYKCTSLNDISLPDALTYIGSYAFSECTALDKIFIPKNVSYIGNEVFYGNKTEFKILLESSTIRTYFSSNFNCYYPYVLGANRETKVSDVFINENNVDYAINNYNSDTPSATLLYPNDKLTDLKVPDTVAFAGSKKANVDKIADYAFTGNEFINTLDLSAASEFNEIGKYAFNNSSLSSIIFNTAIINIASYAFANCENLTSIDLSNTNNITNIASHAFYYDYNLTDVKLPSATDNALNLGIAAFYKCRKLNSLTNLDKIKDLSLNGYTFAECYNLGKDDTTNVFTFSSNIVSITSTDFLDWGTAQDQYIKIANGAYKTVVGSDDVTLVATGEDKEEIVLTKVSEGIYKNSDYFYNAKIILEA